VFAGSFARGIVFTFHPPTLPTQTRRFPASPHCVGRRTTWTSNKSR
jgi:hypothetical protein